MNLNWLDLHLSYSLDRRWLETHLSLLNVFKLETHSCYRKNFLSHMTSHVNLSTYTSWMDALGALVLKDEVVIEFTAMLERGS